MEREARTWRKSQEDNGVWGAHNIHEYDAAAAMEGKDHTQYAMSAEDRLRHGYFRFTNPDASGHRGYHSGSYNRNHDAHTQARWSDLAAWRREKVKAPTLLEYLGR